MLCCAGVCFEEKDLDEGMFQVKSVDEAAELLLPQTPEKLRQLLRLAFAKPAKVLPTCFLTDYINVSTTRLSNFNSNFVLSVYFKIVWSTSS